MKQSVADNYWRRVIDNLPKPINLSTDDYKGVCEIDTDVFNDMDEESNETEDIIDRQKKLEIQRKKVKMSNSAG